MSAGAPKSDSVLTNDIRGISQDDNHDDDEDEDNHDDDD